MLAQNQVEEQFSPEAFPFVVYNQEKNKFEINEETKDFLRKINGPIGVISVAGLYRTGKSYLLNRMLLNQSKGFNVGPTINACTKGIWIWGKPIDGTTPEGEKIKILVLDTEGLGALDEDSNHDVRIFSLAILLSSYFIYNSVGSIDENALQQLSLVVNLTKHIQIKSTQIKEEIDPEEYAQYFPSFMWVVRDFTLQLLNSEKEPITSKDYLEKALTNQKGFSESIEQKNRIRRLLKSFFKERDCCTMIRPLTNEDKLQKLAELELEELRQEFVEQIHTLRRKVINRIKPKQINGKKLNGEMLYNLASSYIDAINQGAVPSIESSWYYICKNECQKAVLESFEIFERSIQNDFYKAAPMFTEELQEIYKNAKKIALEKFNNIAVGEAKDEYLKSLKEKMQSKLALYKLENENISEQACLKFLQQNYDLIAQKLRNQEYENFYELSNEISDFGKYYQDEGPKGPKKNEIGLQFCNKELADSCEFFYKCILNELNLQKEIQKQTEKKLRSELAEVKQEFKIKSVQYEERIRFQDIEKAELQAREQLTNELFKDLQSEKERQLNEFQIKFEQQNRDYKLIYDEMSQKQIQLEGLNKEMNRRLMQSDSEFDKQKALLEQKVQFISEQYQALEIKEKELVNELKIQKQDTQSWKNDQKLKFELQISDLQKTIELQTETIFEMETKLSTQEQYLNETILKFNESETLLKREISKGKDQCSILQKQNDELKLKFENDIRELNDQKQLQIEEKNQKITNLEEINDELQDEYDSLKSKFEKDQAVQLQKIEFLQVQLDQERNQRQNEKKNHENVIRSIQSSQRDSAIGKEEVNKQLNELRVQFQLDLNNLQKNFDLQIQNKETEIHNLSENCQQLELQIQLRDVDFRKETEVLKESLAIAEQERINLSLACKSLEQNKTQFVDDLNVKHHVKIQQLEKELEELESTHQCQLQEINQQSEEQLNQLRQFYESEKQRLEQRFSDEKEKNLKRTNILISEHEQKLREETTNYEDELEIVQRELSQAIQENKQVVSHYSNEVNLKNQQIEAVERYLNECRETLDKQQHTHAIQLSQLQQKMNNERKELTDKFDAFTQEITSKERLCTQLENQRDRLTSQVQSLEKSLNTIREDFEKERKEMLVKLTELKQKLEDKEDELTQKKIDYERQSALNLQTIAFTEQKSADLKSQLESTVQRYEERSKMDREEFQRELQEKSAKLKAEKDNSESKFELKRNQFKELETKLQKEIADAEREKAILNMNHLNVESFYVNEQKHLKNQIARLLEENQLLNDSIASDQQAITQELERIRKENVELERQLQDSLNIYDKDKALWEGRFHFLEQQRDQSKRDFEEASHKFQTTVEQLKKVQNENKNKTETTHALTMQQIQANQNQRLKEAAELHQITVLDLNQKIKQIEREKSQLSEKLEIICKDQQMENQNTMRKNDKLQDQVERLQSELDNSKQFNDQKIQELLLKLEKERINFSNKKRELELKNTKIESKQTEILLSHERDRAKWQQQITDLFHQQDEFRSENDRLRTKVDNYIKEIEKLKQDNKSQRKNFLTASQQQNLPQAPLIGFNGANIMSKLNAQNIQRQSGYTPGMYAFSKLTTEETTGSITDRSNHSRIGQKYQSVGKDEIKSLEMSQKFGGGFLNQTLSKGRSGMTLNFQKCIQTQGSQNQNDLQDDNELVKLTNENE